MAANCMPFDDHCVSCHAHGCEHRLIGNLWSGDLLVFKIGFSGLDSHCPVRIFDSTSVLMKYYFLHFKMISTCIIIGLSRLPLSVFWWLKFRIEYNIIHCIAVQSFFLTHLVPAKQIRCNATALPLINWIETNYYLVGWKNFMNYFNLDLIFFFVG
jgi:hypothetical protein